jgi:hypothetical protein
MSYDTNSTFAYTLHGNKLRLYRYRRSAKKLVDTEGRVDGAGWDPLIYPDETIEDGLRVEYTSLVKPFIDKDPETTAESVDAGADGGYVEDTSPEETSHVNLNRLLSLAVVEYVKASMAERGGNIEAKEYFMKQFYNKLSDNSSNKNRVFIAGAVGPYAL